MLVARSILEIPVKEEGPKVHGLWMGSNVFCPLKVLTKTYLFQSQPLYLTT